MKSQLEKLISEAVKKGFNSSSSMPKITRNQLAEGVRKALRMVIEESGMPGGAMPALGNGAGSGMAITSEEAPSGGSVPSPDELSQALQTSGGWKMKIQGRDFLAYMYATQVAGLEHPDMDSGEGMHAVLSALMAAPPVEKLDPDNEDPGSLLDKTLQAWEIRYGRSGQPIDVAAKDLASNILGVLGMEG